MNRSMISASVGMSALQQRLDIIANNIANMNTTGYKKQEASFQDVLTSRLNQHPDMGLAGRQSTLGLTLGGGARLSGLRLDMTQGSLQYTEDPLAVALEGPAMFEIEVSGANGEVRPLWTRNGQLQLSMMEGEPGYAYLTTSDGYPLLSVDDEYIAIPQYAEFQIDASGIVTYTDEDGEVAEAGQIKLMRLNRPDLMSAVGNGLYGVAAGADPNNVLEQVNFDDPANEGIAVRQYYTEMSNVDLTTEMAELIVMQRTYQLNSRALTSADTMMNLANQLRR